MTQKILDEPAKVYDQIIKNIKSERDYEYVKLMLANFENVFINLLFILI